MRFMFIHICKHSAKSFVLKIYHLCYQSGLKEDRFDFAFVFKDTFNKIHIVFLSNQEIEHQQW